MPNIVKYSKPVATCTIPVEIVVFIILELSLKYRLASFIIFTSLLVTLPVVVTCCKVGITGVPPPELDSKIETIVRENRGFSLQLRDFLCERDYCATNVGNDWIYLDGTHITVQASFTLHASLAEKLDENMGTS